MRSHLVAALVLAGSVAAASGVSAASRQVQVVPWVEDYSTALSQARAKNVPIFVEAWAPW